MLRHSCLFALACLLVAICPSIASDHRPAALQARAPSQHEDTQSTIVRPVPRQNDEESIRLNPDTQSPESARENLVGHVPERSETPQLRHAPNDHTKHPSQDWRPNHDQGPSEDQHSPQSQQPKQDQRLNEDRRPQGGPSAHGSRRTDTPHTPRLSEKNIAYAMAHDPETARLAAVARMTPERFREMPRENSISMKHGLNRDPHRHIPTLRVPGLATDRSMSTQELVNKVSIARQRSRRLEGPEHLTNEMTARAKQMSDMASDSNAPSSSKVMKDSKRHQERTATLSRSPSKVVPSRIDREGNLEIDMRNRKMDRPRSSKAISGQENDSRKEQSFTSQTSFRPDLHKVDKENPSSGTHPRDSSEQKRVAPPGPPQQQAAVDEQSIDHQRRPKSSDYHRGKSDADDSADLGRRDLLGMEKRTFIENKLKLHTAVTTAQRTFKRSLQKRAETLTSPEKVAVLDGEADSALVRRTPPENRQDHRDGGPSSSNGNVERPSADGERPPSEHPQHGNGRPTLHQIKNTDPTGYFHDLRPDSGHLAPSQNNPPLPGSHSSGSTPLGKKRKPEDDLPPPSQKNPFLSEGDRAKSGRSETPQHPKPPRNPEERVNLGQRPRAPNGPLPPGAIAGPQRAGSFNEQDTSSLKNALGRTWPPKPPEELENSHLTKALERAPPMKKLEIPPTPQNGIPPQNDHSSEGHSRDSHTSKEHSGSSYATNEDRAQSMKTKGLHLQDSTSGKLDPKKISEWRGLNQDRLLSEHYHQTHPADLAHYPHLDEPGIDAKAEAEMKKTVQLDDKRRFMIAHPKFWHHQPLSPELERLGIKGPGHNPGKEHDEHHKSGVLRTHNSRFSPSGDEVGSIREASGHDGDIGRQESRSDTHFSRLGDESGSSKEASGSHGHIERQGSQSSSLHTSFLSSLRPSKRVRAGPANTHDTVSENLRPGGHDFGKHIGASFSHGSHKLSDRNRDSINRGSFRFGSGHRDSIKQDSFRHGNGHRDNIKQGSIRHSNGNQLSNSNGRGSGAGITHQLGRGDTARRERFQLFEKLEKERSHQQHEQHTRTLEETNRHLAEKNAIKRERIALDERILREATQKRAGRRGVATGVGIGAAAVVGGLGAAVGFTALGDKLGMEHPAPKILDQLHGQQSQPRGSQGQLFPDPSPTSTPTPTPTPTATPTPTPSVPPLILPGDPGSSAPKGS